MGKLSNKEKMFIAKIAVESCEYQDKKREMRDNSSFPKSTVQRLGFILKNYDGLAERKVI